MRAIRNDNWALRVGHIIKRLRITCELRQVDLARRLGVTPAYVSKLESGQNPPSDELCIKMGEVFVGELEFDPTRILRIAALQAREGINMSDLGLLLVGESDRMVEGLLSRLFFKGNKEGGSA